MDEKTEKLLQSLKNKKVGVFCDDSNLYHSYQKYGWRIDFAKFRKLIERHCYLQFINYYIAVPNRSDMAFFGTQRFLERIEPHVTVKEKQLKYTPVAGKFVKKGDVEIEICLDVVRTIDNLDVAIVVSGDSDLLELKSYVVKDKGKSILFAGLKENMAWELRLCWHLYLNRMKEEISL
jgi:uncharacterized LabA/DUF88 family protein